MKMGPRVVKWGVDSLSMATVTDSGPWHAANIRRATARCLGNLTSRKSQPSTRRQIDSAAPFEHVRCNQREEDLVTKISSFLRSSIDIANYRYLTNMPI